MTWSRRRVLAALGGVGATTMSGCGGLVGEDGSGTDTDSDDGPGTGVGFSRLVHAERLSFGAGRAEGFGEAVALSGVAALVGVHRVVGRGDVTTPATATPTAEGSAAGEVVAFDPERWEQRGGARMPDGAFISDLALSGTTALAGAPTVTDADAPSGTVVVFERSGEWRRAGRLAVQDDSRAFGSAVALAGDTAVVGAPETGQDQGATSVFERRDGAWERTATLDSRDSGPESRFGDAVAIDGDTVAVGAPDDSTAAELAGSVTVFRRAGGDWERDPTLTATDPRSDDSLGWDVAVSGDTVVAGVPFRDAGDEMWSGAVAVFERSEGWRQVATLTPTGGSGGQFGSAVALDGDRAVVGAPTEDSFGERAGAAYAFARSGGDWAQSAKLVAGDGDSEDLFGSAVALRGDRALVSAPADGASASGSAYVFTLA